MQANYVTIANIFYIFFLLYIFFLPLVKSYQKLYILFAISSSAPNVAYTSLMARCAFS